MNEQVAIVITEIPLPAHLAPVAAESSAADAVEAAKAADVVAIIDSTVGFDVIHVNGCSNDDATINVRKFV